MRSEESIALDGCQQVDRVTFRISREEEGMWKGRVRTARGPARPKRFSRGNELPTHSWGAVEMAFDHENGDVIMETNLAAEICRVVEDIGCELFRGE